MTAKKGFGRILGALYWAFLAIIVGGVLLHNRQNAQRIETCKSILSEPPIAPFSCAAHMAETAPKQFADGSTDNSARLLNGSCADAELAWKQQNYLQQQRHELCIKDLESGGNP